MTVIVGVNGFGRIGRHTIVHITVNGSNDIEVVKLKAAVFIKTNAYLLRCDSIHGRLLAEVNVNTDTIDLERGQST